MNHPRGASLRDGALTVSRIYDWFREDFGGNEAGVLNHLRQYALPKLRDDLQRVEDIADYKYDWSLNDVGDAS